MIGHLLRRSWLILLLAAAGGAAAWSTVRDDPRVYERTLTFVVLPSTGIADAQIPDAIRGLAQQDAQLSGTIAGVLGTRPFLQRAAREVVGREVGTDYTLRVAVRPATDILEARLRGPDPSALAKIGGSLTRVASAWVAATYRAYSLEYLEAQAPSRPVSPRTLQVTALAAILGAMLGLGMVYAEAKARKRRREDAGHAGQPTAVGHPFAPVSLASRQAQQVGPTGASSAPAASASARPEPEYPRPDEH